MKSAIKVAAYICDRYNTMYHENIDEMKLHKLLYFAQRESLIQTDNPLFSEEFSGWKYGPVLKEIRNAFKNDTLQIENFDDYLKDTTFIGIMNKIFENYADKSSWSLSRLSHGEISWQKSREGLETDENGDNPICLDDIRLDAERVKYRREMLKKIEERCTELNGKH